MNERNESTLPLPGRRAPELTFDVLGVPESRWDLSEAEPKQFSMLVFYRGLHCPVCKTYLRTIDSMFDEFADRGVEIAAISMDTEDRAQESKDEWGIENLPIGYGLDEATARRWGLYISSPIIDAEPRRFSEPGLFLVRRDGTLHYVAINSMPFGRPDPKDVLKAIDFILEKDYPARGKIAA